MLSDKEHISLRKTINREIRRARKYDLERMKNMFVCDTGDLLYISKEIVDTLTEATGCIKRDIRHRPEIIKVIQDTRTFFANNRSCAAVLNVSIPFLSKSIKVIALNDSSEFDACNTKYSELLHLTDNFNHEAGHWLIESGTPLKYDPLEKRHLAECIAEAYKALRHKQLFGNETDFLDNNNFSHAIILGKSPIHYKDVINQKVDALAKELAEKEIHLSELSYEQTLHLARDIAVKYHLKKKTLNKITEAFKPVADYYNSNGHLNTTTPKKVFEVMIANKNNHHIYRAGKRYLDRKLSKKQIHENDSFWIDAEKQMRKFEKGNKHLNGIVLSLSKVADIHLGKKAITADDVQAIIDNRNKSINHSVFPRHQVSFAAP